MPHLVLIGDSILDNQSYVPDQPCVTDQVQALLDDTWQVTCLATDGDRVVETLAQIEQLPVHSTHIVVSAGGNDALHAWDELYQPVGSVTEALHILQTLHEAFLARYRNLLQHTTGRGAKVLVCTIPVCQPQSIHLIYELT